MRRRLLDLDRLFHLKAKFLGHFAGDLETDRLVDGGKNIQTDETLDEFAGTDGKFAGQLFQGDRGLDLHFADALGLRGESRRRRRSGLRRKRLFDFL